MLLHLLTIKHLQYKRESSDGGESVPAAAPSVTGRVVIVVAIFNAVVVATGDEARAAACFEAEIKGGAAGPERVLVCSRHDDYIGVIVLK